MRKLDETDKWARKELQEIPDSRRRVITSHDAFGYFSRDFGITFHAPQGWSTDDQPAAAKIASLIRQIRETHITALFVENITDPRMMEQLARETKGRIGGRLYSDALSRPGGPADSYLKLFRHNVETLKSGMVVDGPLPKRH
ncbi:MAG: zinc ABC transporter substrate-binding protein [Fibrobacterota bacterium]|nr:zinc ABC transporter substrate-binding protein [Fibrobacterota bacterium]